MNKLEKFLKKNKICPVCAAKKLMNGVRIQRVPAPLENGAAPTPPMGWASWNLFGRNINETIVAEMAETMRKLHQRAGLYLRKRGRLLDELGA